jgi:hypothetical protein
MGGTIRYVNSLQELRQADYKFVVCQGSVGTPVERHLSVLQFVKARPKPVQGQARPVQHTADYKDRSVTLALVQGDSAERFEVCEAATSRGLGTLINETIVKNIPLGGHYDVLRTEVWVSEGTYSPLIAEVDGRALGAIRTTGEGTPEWWTLPALTTDRASWLRAIVALWKARYPDDFPPAGLASSERWMTHTELEATAAIANHEVETAAYLEARSSQLRRLEEASVEAARAAEGAEKSLLTAQGDVLVRAVQSCLAALGFEVTDSDAAAEANSAAKREDLQIRSDLHREWLALAEIKGYSKRNAKTSDLAQLARAVGFFERSGPTPKAQWYIVNAQFGLPPDERPVPLASSPDDVEVFAENGGLVVDTRELFQLLRLTQSGQLSKEEAQKCLVSATGTFQAPELSSSLNSERDQMTENEEAE